MHGSTGAHVSRRRTVSVQCSVSNPPKNWCECRKVGITGLKSNHRLTGKYAHCLHYLHFTGIKIPVWLSEVKRRCTHWLKIKMQARNFQIDVLTSRIGKKNQSALIWGYWSLLRLWLRSQKRLTSLHLSNLSKNYNKCREFGITGLKSRLRATEIYAYCLDYLHFIWLSKVNCYVHHFNVKSG